MVILGNFLLAIAAIIFLSVCNLTYFRTPPGGDAVVGYAWSIIIGIAAFSICLAIVAAIIGWQGGFGWVGSDTGPRVTLVLLGTLLVLVGNGFFMANEYPSFLSVGVRRVVRAIPAILPILLLVSAAILLNAKYVSLPALVYKIPVYSSLIISALGLFLIMMGQAQNTAAVIESELAFQDKIHQDHLNQIDTTDVTKDMVFILVFTDSNHDADVREKALAKIKSHPDWQGEIIRILQEDYAPEAFTFLASNDVDDKKRFLEPVQQGVLVQARLIRQSIRRCRGDYDLRTDSFRWEVERMLRTLDKFKGLGVDYKPAVQEVRSALDEPTDFEKPQILAKQQLEKWLVAH